MSTATQLLNTTAKSPSLSKPSHAGLLLQRQCACGSLKSALTGECEECKGSLQTKLSIGASNDPLEQEADRVAEQVLATSPHAEIRGTKPGIQRYSGKAAAGAAPASVNRVLSSPGHALDVPFQHDMEQRFGHDFSQVRVHTSGTAAQSARDMHAHAYTVGNNIVFGANQFAPATHKGRKLIAHELTHVVQQRGGEQRVQRQFSGCQNLLTTPGDMGLLSGIAAHGLIGAHFRQTVADAVNVAIPGAYAGPLRSQAICGGDTRVINPQIVGGTAARAGAGLPDLARRTPGGILQVAEIKPAALPCLIDGEEQELRYIDNGNARDDVATAWRASQGISVVAPMLPNSYNPPTLAVSIPGGMAELRTAWCTPGLLAYAVNLQAVPPPVLVPEPEPVRVRSRARARSRANQPQSSAIPWATALAILGALLTILAMTPPGRLGALIGTIVGGLLRILGFSLGIAGGLAAAAASTSGKSTSTGGTRAGNNKTSDQPARTQAVPSAQPAPGKAAATTLTSTPKAQLNPHATKISLIEKLNLENLAVGMLPAVWLYPKGNPAGKLFAVLQVTKVVPQGNQTTVEFKSLLENSNGKNTLGGNLYSVTHPYRGNGEPALVGERVFTSDGSADADPGFIPNYMSTLADELENAGRKTEASQVRNEVQRLRSLTRKAK